MGVLEQLMGVLVPAKPAEKQALTHRVVLGALLSLISKADGMVSSAEIQAKRNVLEKNGFTTSHEQDEILAAAKQAVHENLDWQTFTREINAACEYPERVKLVRELFSIAWADHALTDEELEAVRKIANLLWVDHKDFIAAKMETKPGSQS